jgi:hypothetical protein
MKKGKKFVKLYNMDLFGFRRISNPAQGRR